MGALPLATRLFSIVGLATVALSVAWWWLTYRDVVGYAYMSLGDAGVCLVRNTDICQLARSLCRGTHPSALVAYWSASIWLGLSAIAISLLTASG